jgi:RNase H-like domain found in reverse transcriptase/Reverse transcriptase (RNA-dependent DNA polymerase)/Integrase zinc binding domain/Chromo (CHRromatin Organisation MOdifier) domain/gag-polyprotein putative aspartyl protease
LKSYAEAADGQSEEARTSECEQLSTAIASSSNSERERDGKQERTRARRRRKRKERDKALVQAATALLGAVQHDSAQLIVISAVIDGHRCDDVLVDAGASSNFVREDWVKEASLPVKRMRGALKVTLADGKVAARLTHAVQVQSLQIQGSSAPCTLTVMGQLSHQVIVGLPWLRRAGVAIDYKHLRWNGQPIHRAWSKGVDGVQLQELIVDPEHTQRMKAILTEYPAAFSRELRPRTVEDIAKAIKATVTLRDPNVRPARDRERRKSPADIAALTAAVQEMLDKGLIRPSSSEWVSQAVMVKKYRDGVELKEKRPCWDYRRVNDLIKGDAFPLPLPENMFDVLQGSRVFSKLDLTKGFWQIPLDEASKAILAMSTPIGLMEPNYMPFGMKNAPAIFQREMQRVFMVRLGNAVLVFIDDILIFTKTVEEHEEAVRWVLRRLCEEGYYANPDKCEFFMKEVSFLGHVINEHGIHVQQHKVKAVRDWPTPTSRTQVKAFLGLTGYYRKFVSGYSRVAMPLTELTKISRRFEWGAEQQRAFDQLKEGLTSAPVLAHPDPTRQYLLNTDASGFAIAAVLSQQQEDGKVRPVAYYSRKMNSAERNYDVHDKELLAIVMAVKHWRCYLDGSPHPTKVLTDHKGLQWLNSKAELTGRQARWVELLADVEYEVSYIPGKQNAVADALSRREDLEAKVEDPAVEGGRQQLQAPRLKIHLAEVQGAVTEERPLWESRVQALTFRDELKKAAAADPWYSAKLSETAPTDGLLRGDGLLWTEDGRFYVPDDREVQSKLLYEVHDAPTGGHMGERKTLNKMQRTCYWHGMQKDIEDYVRGCQVCAAVKSRQKAPAGLLQPLPIPHRPWEVITLDLMGPLPMSEDHHSAVWAVTCKFSKQVHLIATSMKVTSEKTARLLIDHVFKLHGLPRTIISDRDPRFTAGLWRAVFKAWGTRLAMSSSYHPQTDGQTERYMRVLAAGLRAYADKRQRDWPKCLSMIEAFYNSSRHESTGQTPFEMNGVVWTDAMTLALSSPMMDGIKSQSAEDILTDMRRTWEDARRMLLVRREKMKAEADRHRTEERYAVGDQVLLSTRHLSTHSSKLDDPFVGPFAVTRVSDNGVNIWLELPRQYRRLHQPFHVEKLKRFVPSAVEWSRQQEDRPLPEMVDGAPMYEVEMLLGKRTAQEWVDVQPEDAVTVDSSEDVYAGTSTPTPTEKVVEDAEVTVRRSARLASKPSSQPTAAPRPTRKPRRVRQLVTRYLVKWKGYGVEEATWERASNLQLHAQEAIDEYEYRQAQERGEETVGVQCVHSLRSEADGSLFLLTAVVSDVGGVGLTKGTVGCTAVLGGSA